MQCLTLMYSLRGGGVGAGVGGGGVGLGPLKNNFFVIISLFKRLRTSEVSKFRQQPKLRIFQSLIKKLKNVQVNSTQPGRTTPQKDWLCLFLFHSLVFVSHSPLF